MTDPKPTHGGKRANAGRKPNPHGAATKHSITLRPDVLLYLRTLDSISGQIDTAIRSTRGFKRFVPPME